MNKNTTGFTIVELLIVIVVIAILAAISIVAYTGIQNRAYDTTVKSDLANMARSIQLVHATTGSYPAGGRTQHAEAMITGDYTVFPGFSFQPSKSAYFIPTESGQVNFAYCAGMSATTNEPKFAIMARSTSGAFLSQTSDRGMRDMGTSGVVTLHGLCEGIAYPRTFSYGYIAGDGWQAWTD